MWLDKLWEHKESVSRTPVPDEAVAKVKDDIEYSNHLIKVHNVMNVLDLPNNQEEAFREFLTKQDNKILEELSKKSKKEIQEFLLLEKNNERHNKKWLTDIKENQTIKVESEETNKQLKNNQQKNIENQKNDSKFNHLKSYFTPQILEQNRALADEFKDFNNKSVEKKDEAIQKIISILKDNPSILKSITEQLWWADKNNKKYLEFKNTLVGLDSWFDKYFQDLEKINSGNSLNADEVIKWIEKDSWWMVELDLNSNTPTSKLSLIWSQYSFSEEIDKKAYSEIMGKWEKELADVENSKAVFNGLNKPFNWLLKNIKENWWKENLKEKINESVSNFSKNLFWDLDEVYEKTGIKSDIQIKESDVNAFTDIKSENDLKSKFENFKEKVAKIKEKIEDFKTWILNKYKWEIKDVLSLKSEKQEKQVKVLGFMQDSGFDLMPKEISDKFLWQLQSNTLNIPWLDLDTKNINLKNWNFWESVLYKDDCLNIHAKTNMLKFMNKMISWDISQPLNVESIANGAENVNPNFLQSKFLENWIVDNLGWREWKISENLSKLNNWWNENKA